MTVDLELGTATDGFGDTDTLSSIEQVLGTTGADSISGASGGENLFGGDGDDTLRGNDGNDYLAGDGGTDIAVFSGNSGDHAVTTADSHTYTVSGSDGIDTLVGIETLRFDDGDYAIGDLAVDSPISLAGTSGDDTLFGGSGNDTLDGQDGNDVLHGLGGDDQINGDAGMDTAVFSGNYADYTVTGSNGDWTVTGTDGADTLTSVEVLQFDDQDYSPGITLSGSGGADVMDGGTEADSLYGNWGDDTISGHDGDDILDGGGENDILDGGAGNDTLYAGFGADSLTGGTGDDVLDATDNEIELDTAVYSGSSTDYTWTDSGSGTWTVTDNRGIDGTDTLHEVEKLHFEGDGQTIDLNYYLHGSNSAEVLDGGTKADSIFGNWGDDTISGHDGDDILDGGGENDILDGGAGNDTLYAGFGADSLTGGTGDDVLDATDNEIELDTAVYSGSSTDYTWTDSGSGTWTVTDNRGIDGTDTLHEVEKLHFEGDGQTIDLNYYLHGSNSAEVLDGGTKADSIFGNWGDDTISGHDGDDILDGGGENDLLDGGAGDDAIDGGAGTDIAVFSGNSGDYTVTTVDDVEYTISGADGTDTLYDIETLRFDNGDFAIASLVAGPVSVIDGTVGDDILQGDADANSINGFDGNDTLIGGDGADTFTGGSGNDVILYTLNNQVLTGDQSVDRVTDFYAGVGGDLFGFQTNNPDGSLGLGPIADLATVHNGGFQPGVGPTGTQSYPGNFWDYGYWSAGSGSGSGTGVGITTAVATGAAAHINQIDWSNSWVAKPLFIFAENGSTGNLFYAEAFDKNAPSVTKIAEFDADSGTFIGDFSAGNIFIINEDAVVDGGEILLDDPGLNTNLVGSANIDQIHASDGDDTINGGAGDDYLDGGDGDDTAVFSGNWADYAISNDGSELLTISGADGIDVLTGVEHLEFADQTVDVHVADQHYYPQGTNGRDNILIGAGVDGALLVSGNQVNYHFGGDGVQTFNGTTGTDYLSFASALGAVTVDLGGVLSPSPGRRVRKPGTGLGYRTCHWFREQRYPDGFNGRQYHRRRCRRRSPRRRRRQRLPVWRAGHRYGDILRGQFRIRGVLGRQRQFLAFRYRWVRFPERH